MTISVPEYCYALQKTISCGLFHFNICSTVFVYDSSLFIVYYPLQNHINQSTIMTLQIVKLVKFYLYRNMLQRKKNIAISNVSNIMQPY